MSRPIHKIDIKKLVENYSLHSLDAVKCILIDKPCMVSEFPFFRKSTSGIPNENAGYFK